MLLEYRKLKELSPDVAKVYWEDEREYQFQRSCERCQIEEEIIELKACGGCVCSPRRTFYCSYPCQKEDWKRHKSQCRTRRNKYSDWDPTSKRFIRQKKTFKWVGRALHINSSAFHWAARQAFLANPTINPRKTVLHVDCVSYLREDVIRPTFPFQYKFYLLTEEELAILAPEKMPECRGFFSTLPNVNQEITPIVTVSPNWRLDFMDVFVPQWPYIFAQVVMENESSNLRATIKLVEFIKLVRALDESESPLKEYISEGLDEGWVLDKDDFLDWEKLLKEII